MTKPLENVAVASSGEALSLPWHQGDEEDRDDDKVCRKNGDIVADCGYHANLSEEMDHIPAQRAAYIVHAANAYPKLVVALRKYVEALKIPLHRAVLDGSDGRTLLRELGELK